MWGRFWDERCTLLLRVYTISFKTVKTNDYNGRRNLERIKHSYILSMWNVSVLTIYELINIDVIDYSFFCSKTNIIGKLIIIYVRSFVFNNCVWCTFTIIVEKNRIMDEIRRVRETSNHVHDDVHFDSYVAIGISNNCISNYYFIWKL